MAALYTPIEGSTSSWSRRRRVLAAGCVLAAGALGAAAISRTASPASLHSKRVATALAVKSIAVDGLDQSTFATLKNIKFGEMSEGEKSALWASFQTQFSRSYESESEQSSRYAVFLLNLNYIDALNVQNPHAIYGLSDVADKTTAERTQRRMSSQQVTNYTAVKARLKSVMGDDMFAQAEAGEFADGLKRDFSERKLQEESGHSQSWTSGLEMSNNEATTFELSQGEVGWASETDCAACDRYPELGQYNLGYVPEDFDWRDMGAVTSVKNQAYCGSCWSFSTAADVEGTHFLATGILTDYAPQQLVECNTMNMGCDGGYPFAAMQYISHMGGLATWKDLPYKNVYYGDSRMNPTGTPECSKDVVNEALASSEVAHISGFQFVGMGADYEPLMRVVLVKNGPVSVAFNANGMDFYIHGVAGCTSEDECGAGSISHPDQDGEGEMFTCDPESLDHAVLVVGYGVEHSLEEDARSIPYWLIKNSWDDSWGEDGYYRLVRGENACGVANMVVHSVVKA